MKRKLLPRIFKLPTMAPLPIAILAMAVASVVPCQASTMFTDGTFDLATNYTQTMFTNNTAAAGSTFSVTQSTTAGNPPPSLDFHVDWTVNTTFTIDVGLINSNFTYNPASGLISTIDFSLDKNVTFTSGTVVFMNATATPLLEQNGKFYVDTITGPAFTSGTWQTVSATGLTASNFSLYDFNTNTVDSTMHPDFSAAGGVIDFGLRTGLGHTNTLGTGSFDALSDNLSFTITSVPETSSTSTLLILSLLFWLTAARFRSLRHLMRKRCSHSAILQK
jgi:hypothetical protein